MSKTTAEIQDMATKLELTANAHDAVGAINGIFTGDSKSLVAFSEAQKKHAIPNGVFVKNTLTASPNKKAIPQAQLHSFMEDLFLKGDLPEFTEKNGKYEAELIFRNAADSVAPIKVVVDKDVYDAMQEARGEAEAAGTQDVGLRFAYKVKLTPNRSYDFNVSVGKLGVNATGDLAPDFTQASTVNTKFKGNGTKIDISAFVGQDELASYQIEDFDRTMRAHQNDIFRSCAKSLRETGNTQTSLLIDAGTGTGKTGMIAHALSSISSGTPGGGVVLVPESMVKECKDETPLYLPKNNGILQNVVELKGLIKGQDEATYLTSALQTLTTEKYISMSHDALRHVMDLMDDPTSPHNARAREVFDALKRRNIAADESHELTADSLDLNGKLVENKYVGHIKDLAENSTFIGFTGTPNNNLYNAFGGRSHAQISVNKVMNMGTIRPVAALSTDVHHNLELKAAQQALIGNNIIDSYRDNPLVRDRLVSEITDAMKDPNMLREVGISDPNLVKGIKVSFNQDHKISFKGADGLEYNGPGRKNLEHMLHDVVERHTNINLPNMTFTDTPYGQRKVSDYVNEYLENPKKTKELKDLHSSQMTNFLSDIGCHTDVQTLANYKEHDIQTRAAENQKFRAIVGMASVLSPRVSVDEKKFRDMLSNSEPIDFNKIIKVDGGKTISENDIDRKIASLPEAEKQNVKTFLQGVVACPDTNSVCNALDRAQKEGAYPGFADDLKKHSVHSITSNTDESKAIIQFYSPQSIVSHDLLTTGYSNKHIMGVNVAYTKPITTEIEFGKLIQTIGRGIRDGDLIANNTFIRSRSTPQFEVEIDGQMKGFSINVDKLFGEDASDIQRGVGQMLAVSSRLTNHIGVSQQDYDDMKKTFEDMSKKGQITEFTPLKAEELNFGLGSPAQSIKDLADKLDKPFLKTIKDKLKRFSSPKQENHIPSKKHESTKNTGRSQ